MKPANHAIERTSSSLRTPSPLMSNAKSQTKVRNMKVLRMKEIILLSIATLSGCATSSQVYTADGKRGHSINCSGSALNWGMCYEKAGEICGAKGYEVLQKSGDQGTVVSGNQFGLYGGSVMNRSMIIQCKE